MLVLNQWSANVFVGWLDDRRRWVLFSRQILQFGWISSFVISEGGLIRKFLLSLCLGLEGSIWIVQHKRNVNGIDFYVKISIWVPGIVAPGHAKNSWLVWVSQDMIKNVHHNIKPLIDLKKVISTGGWSQIVKPLPTQIPVIFFTLLYLKMS